MPLTDIELRNLKSRDKPYKVSDGNGLYVLVTPEGGKLWRYAYRFDGKQKTLALGIYAAASGKKYQAVSLAEARKYRDAAWVALKAGTDPAVKKKHDASEARQSRQNTFEIVAAEVIDKKRREGRAKVTLDKREWLYGIANAAFGARPITEITPSEVLSVLKRVEEKGKLETARRLRSVVGEVFRYAIATARASNDPTFALRGALTAPQVKHRAAIIDPKAVGELLRRIDGFQGQPTTVAALKLMAYLFPRPGELRTAEWAEVDLDNAIWIIPAAKAKMRREHRVPLPEQAIAVLRQLQGITGGNRLVFPGFISAAKPISENTLNCALRRIGYTADQMTSHGFRATASTLLNESGKFSIDAIERALAHVEGNAVRRAYQRGEFWEERVRMMRWWADYLGTLRDGAKVITGNFGGAA
jgi:integrase